MGNAAGNAEKKWEENPFDPAGKNSTPEPPDFAAAAREQADSSRINQNTPFGSTTWTKDPITGRATQNTQLAGGLGTGLGSLMNQIGSQGALGTGDEAGKAASDAYYRQATSRLDPQWQQRREQFGTQMANQGLDPGTEAYHNAAGELGRAQNDAYATAENDAQTKGLQRQNLTFAQNVQSMMSPYERMSGLAGLLGGLSGTGTQTQSLPAAMAGYQGALDSYGAKQAQKNSMMSGAAQMYGGGG